LQDIELMGYPLVVKPNAGGSSVGVQIVHDRSALLAAVAEVFKWDNEIIIEQYLIGDEITCPILNEQLLPVLSIKHTAVFLTTRQNMTMLLPWRSLWNYHLQFMTEWQRLR